MDKISDNSQQQQIIEKKPAKVILRFVVGDEIYNIPKELADKYKEVRKLSISELWEQYGNAGAFLKAVRHQAELNQIQFAKKIKVTQADLSKMESGKRPIGKNIAKRIQKVCKVNYRYFLE